MVLVILAIGILLLVGGLLLYKFSDEEPGVVGASILTVAGGAITIAALISTVVLAVSVTNLNTVDARIEMYQQENTKIEQSIANAIEQHQEYESGVYSEITPNSSIEMVIVYPELKSDVLIQKQIENYISNNDKIKTLQEEKIQGSVDRWWLYFGQ